MLYQVVVIRYAGCQCCNRWLSYSLLGVTVVTGGCCAVCHCYNIWLSNSLLGVNVVTGYCCFVCGVSLLQYVVIMQFICVSML